MAWQMDPKKGQTFNYLQYDAHAPHSCYLCSNPQQPSNVVHHDLLLLAPQLFIEVCMVTFISQATSVEAWDLACYQWYQ